MLFQPLMSRKSENSPRKDDGIYDSVELSFMGKLEKAEMKDNEDLRAFELLEEAAQDSSFCSSSSTVKKIINNSPPMINNSTLSANQNSAMPSPIPKRSESQTSTPKVERLKSNQKQKLVKSSLGKIFCFCRSIYRNIIIYVSQPLIFGLIDCRIKMPPAMNV